MFASRAALRQGLRRTAVTAPRNQTISRGMAGGKYLHVSETHKLAGEAFGVICWLWVFHRARQDLPVMYGYRHPWEHGDDHGHDDHAHTHHATSPSASATEMYEKFAAKAMIQTEVDDDDDDDDDDEED